MESCQPIKRLRDKKKKKNKKKKKKKKKKNTMLVIFLQLLHCQNSSLLTLGAGMA
jgi:hypothetical protein